MKHAFFALGAALLLGACASPTEKSDAEVHAACRDNEPRIGSNMMRRSDCGMSKAQDKDGTRRDMEILQQQQTLRTAPPSGKP